MSGNTEENSWTPVTLTPFALEKAIALESEQGDFKGKMLRLYLDGKGCDGFYYGVTFDRPSKEDIRFVLDGGNGLELLVDKDTINYVEGSSIDWIDDDRGQGFLVDNPNHKKFRGKFFKRKSWQDRLLSEHPQ